MVCLYLIKYAGLWVISLSIFDFGWVYFMLSISKIDEKDWCDCNNEY